MLEGFGATGSVSYTDYKLKPAADQRRRVLPGFSKWVYNVTGYYEKNGIQARASYRHRSKFKGEVVALFTEPRLTLIQPDNQSTRRSATLSSRVRGSIGLGILLQVSNVLNSPYRTYLPTGPDAVPMLETDREIRATVAARRHYHF